MLHFLNTRFEELLGAFLLAVMACIAFINIIVRYFTMSVVYSCTKGWLRKALYIFSVICCLAFFVWLVYLGAIEVIDEMDLNVSSESLDIPVWLYTMATPLFSLLIIVRILQRTVEDFRLNRF